MQERLAPFSHTRFFAWRHGLGPPLLGLKVKVHENDVVHSTVPKTCGVSVRPPHHRLPLIEPLIPTRQQGLKDDVPGIKFIRFVNRQHPDNGIYICSKKKHPKNSPFLKQKRRSREGHSRFTLWSTRCKSTGGAGLGSLSLGSSTLSVRIKVADICPCLRTTAHHAANRACDWRIVRLVRIGPHRRLQWCPPVRRYISSRRCGAAAGTLSISVTNVTHATHWSPSW